MNALTFMEQLTFPILQEMSRTMHQKFVDHPISFAKDSSNRLERGDASWKEPEKFRSRFHPIFAMHIEDFLKSTPSLTSLKVLELGAGHLTEGRSSLSRHLPEAAAICYSDLSLKAAQDAWEKSPSSQYLHLDSSRIKEKIEPCSMDVVMASCFLDTLPKEELMATMQQVSEILKTGGTFFHISDLEPYFNTLAVDHKDDSEIMFPCLDNDQFITGIQFVPKAACEIFIRNNRSRESAFLEQYMALSNDARAAVVVEICTIPASASIFSKWVKQTFGDTRKIINETFFHQRLEESLKSANFEVLTFGNRLKSKNYSRAECGEEKYNDICSLHGRLREKIIPDKTDVTISLGVHILLATKKSESL